jgi:hypothetical protein
MTHRELNREQKSQERPKNVQIIKASFPSFGLFAIDSTHCTVQHGKKYEEGKNYWAQV